MYLSSDVIRQMLCQFDDCFFDIPIYVSCEFGKTKRSGSLYIEVKIQENADYKNWVHYGDNQKADIDMPKKLGIKTIKSRIFISNVLNVFSFIFIVLIPSFLGISISDL